MEERKCEQALQNLYNHFAKTDLNMVNYLKSNCIKPTILLLKTSFLNIAFL